MERANDTLNEIGILLQNQFYNNAVNRLYYACFYAVSALLVSKEIQSKTHSGTKQMFGLHFVKTGIVSSTSGSFYTDIFTLRQTGDYDDYVVFEKEELVSLLSSARNLLKEIEQIIAQK